MQFFTLHRVSIFSNSLDNDNNEKTAEFIEKLSLFIYIKKTSFLKILSQKKGLIFFNIDSFVELDELYPTMYKNRQKKFYSIFELRRPQLFQNAIK